MKLKPFYSIQELSDILGVKVHAVADGLVAYGIPALYAGKEVTLSQHECFRPTNNQPSCVFIRTDTNGDAINPFSPDPETVTVSTNALPPLWVESIASSEPTILEEQVPVETPLTISQRNNLLKQIGTLALLISEKNGRYKKGGKPNALQISEGIQEIIDALPDSNKRGVSGSNIRESIKEGLSLLTIASP